MTIIRTITLDELTQQLQAGAVAQLWNVLTDDYYTGELIPGSRHVAVDRIGRELAALELPSDTAIVVYCSGPTCPNSGQAAEKLVAFGYTNVRAYKDGLEGWKGAGRPVDRVEVGTGAVPTR